MLSEIIGGIIAPNDLYTNNVERGALNGTF
jgi:hypothetical protein